VTNETTKYFLRYDLFHKDKGHTWRNFRREI